MERGNRRVQYIIVSAVCTGAFSSGVSFAWATPVLPKVARNEIGFELNNAEISWLVSISSLGFVLGCLISRTTAEKWGRRPTLLSSTLPMLVGTLLMIFCWDLWSLLAGRILWGCSTGLFLTVSIVYIGEIVDKEIRGSLSLANRCAMSFGFLTVIVVGAFVSFHTLSCMHIVLPVIIFGLNWWIPESPYYLLKAGKVESAKQTLQLLTNARDEEVLNERLSQMQHHVRVEMTQSDTIKELFTGKRYRKALLIVAGIKVPQIATGLHAIHNYLGPIVSESDSGMTITTAIIIFGVCRFLLGIMSSLLVDRLGRRPLLIYSFFGTSVVLSGVAAYFGFHDRLDLSYPLTLSPFIGIVIALIIAILGYESVTYLVPAELFPLNIKTVAMTTVSISAGFMNFLSVKTYQQIKDWLGLTGVFVLYASAAFIGSVLSYLLVPETKGKSLKEIQIELNGNIYDEEEKLNKVAVEGVKENGEEAQD